MAKFVLVHGAWHGAWCWERLTPILQAAGHEVIIPDLPGMGADAAPAVPLNTVVAKEITLRGTFRFHEEFAWAVDFIVSRRIDVRPLLTEVVPLAEAVRAFDLATDRSRAMKVLLSF